MGRMVLNIGQHSLEHIDGSISPSREGILTFTLIGKGLCYSLSIRNIGTKLGI